MYVGIRREPEPEQPPCDERRAEHDHRQLVLGLLAAAAALGEPPAQPVPEGRRHCRQRHGHEDTQEGQPDLPEVEAVVGREDEWKGAEEEVQQPEEHGRVQVEDQAHGLVVEHLQRTQQRHADGLPHGTGRAGLHGRQVARVAGRLAEAGGFVGEEDGVRGIISFFSRGMGRRGDPRYVSGTKNHRASRMTPASISTM
jgi:hypothetical protein